MEWLFITLSIAAIAGDTVNYSIGHYIGPRVFHDGKYRFLKREYLDRTHRFYEKHGGKTIVIARFIPIIRTFAPFVAGIGAMTYPRFIAYNVIGGISWIGHFHLRGLFLRKSPPHQEQLYPGHHCDHHPVRHARGDRILSPAERNYLTSDGRNRQRPVSGAIPRVNERSI